MTRSIEILQADSLRATYGRAADGLMALTLQADVAWSDLSQSRAFVKCFHQTRELGLVNEVTGYVIAKGCQLPIPQKAALIRLPEPVAAELPDFAPWAFAVSEAPGHTPNTLVQLRGRAVLHEVAELLAGWSRLCEAIAFDDWTANCDRNLGNFLIGGPDQVVLIDHSNLPVDLNWDPKDLQPGGQFTSMLMKIVQFAKKATLPQRMQVGEAARRHSQIYSELEDELLYWWNLLLKNDPSRRAALEQFIAHRAANGYQRVTTNQHLLAV